MKFTIQDEHGVQSFHRTDFAVCEQNVFGKVTKFSKKYVLIVTKFSFQ